MNYCTNPDQIPDNIPNVLVNNKHLNTFFFLFNFVLPFYLILKQIKRLRLELVNQTLHSEYSTSVFETLMMILQETKLMCYNNSAVCLEFWIFYSKNTTVLDSFDMHCWRHICCMEQQNKAINATILSNCNILGMEAHLIKSQVKCSGYVIQMNDNFIPK